jgi:magnesium-transporting ATPase (P-type)
MTATLFWAPQRAEAHRDERDTIDLRSTRLDDDDDERSSTAFRIAMMTNVLCNHATLADGESAVGAKGDPTEIALLVAAERSSFGEHYWRSEREFSVLGEAPFDSDRKRMSVVVSEGVDAKLTLLAKGAVETIVGRCSRVLLGRRVLRLRTSMIRRIDERNSALAGRGLRVLALAYRRLDASRLQAARVEAARRRDEADADVDVDDDVNDRKNAVERTNDDNNNDMTGAVQALEDGGLVFVGLIGLIDPPRSTARDTVSQCHDAGQFF